MKRLFCPLLLLVLFSCKKKEPTQSDFMQRALQSNDYKIVSANFERVNDSLDVMKKRPIDTNVVIYEYNTIAGSATTQVKTIAQVIKEMEQMNKDTSFLKSIQQGLAAQLAKDHQDSISKSKP